MDCASECAEVVRGGMKELRIINLAQKHEGIVMYFEFLGSSGRNISVCSRELEEVSSVERRVDFKSMNEPSNRSCKTWRNCMQWLRHG